MGGVIQTARITGRLSVAGTITGRLSALESLSGKMNIPEVVGVTLYDGEYVVSPDFEGSILETKDKLLRQDVTVNPIEVQTVSNLSGGKTVYIGGII